MPSCSGQRSKFRNSPMKSAKGLGVKFFFPLKFWGEALGHMILKGRSTWGGWWKRTGEASSTLLPTAILTSRTVQKMLAKVKWFAFSCSFFGLNVIRGQAVTVRTLQEILLTPTKKILPPLSKSGVERLNHTHTQAKMPTKSTRSC